MVLRALSGNPLRSLLTTLGVIIGVAAVVTTVSIGAGARRSVEEQALATLPSKGQIVPRFVGSAPLLRRTLSQHGRVGLRPKRNVPPVAGMPEIPDPG
ncbi:MAG: ABC transporter permease [Armatimonadota bacterium]|nr:ABC transporter permease [Armatimonadota bacterium]MDR7440258.1 ABC transporter permease [Armatimonadota bacterium]MDR7444585.1 ABC transporter permease [Armatimonadota bacterium]MDR7570249.1 ABC transporter permease [Armatimonadota bacterium]MDR7615555.1 ABC transporter permease [Armatimonadota bacterium]